MPHKGWVQKPGRQWIASFGVVAALCQAVLAEPKPLAPPTGFPPPSGPPINRPASPVIQNGDTVKVGDKITARKSSRTISFPAWVNQREGVIEYALVTRTGKTHESLFATDADAKDLHVTALLLNAVPESIIGKPNEAWVVPPASAVSIRASWKVGEEEKSYDLADLMILRDPKAGGPDRKFPSGPWFYNGSRLIEGGAFLAQAGGSIVSMIYDPDALINNPQVDKNDDDIHFLNTPVLPPLGTPVTIILQLGGKAGPPAREDPPATPRKPIPPP
jgi:hypothetical protein